MRFGYKPSPPHKMGMGHPAHLLAQGELPPSADVPLPPAVDQLEMEGCVGNSVAVAVCAAVAIWLHKAGAPLIFQELPSRLWFYFLARALNGDQDRDEGTFIHSAFEAGHTSGFPKESAWPFSDDPKIVNKQPDPEVYREAFDQCLIKGYYRISSTGSQRVRDVMAALAAGHVVVWGTQLDRAFMTIAANDVWPGVTGPIEGGHAMVLHGYAPWKTGHVKFKTRSSWGDSFADQGSAWVADTAIASPNAEDFWVLEVGPTYSGTT